MHNNHAQGVDSLGAAILRGALAPDAVLPRDADLAQQFGVSRTVLREAIKPLTARGLRVARLRVGTRVTPGTSMTTTC